MQYSTNNHLTRDDALSLSSITGDDLERLMESACERRAKTYGNTITYSRKVFIPLTNMCRNRCAYCNFVKPPCSLLARYLSPDEILNIAIDGKKLGCKEALFSLGEAPESRHQKARDTLKKYGYCSTLDYLYDMCELVLNETGLIPHVNAGTLEKEDIIRFKEVTGSMGMMLENVSPRLTQKGYVHYLCPDKSPDKRIKTLVEAGELNVPFTTGILIGIGETWEERVESLFCIQNIFEEFGHIQEVIIQNYRSGTKLNELKEPAIDDILKTIATARLVLDPGIGLQAPPNLQMGNYVKYLQAGINDWGGISPLTPDHINPGYPWPDIEILKKDTRYAGLCLRERLTVYPELLSSREKYLSNRLWKFIKRHIDTDGFARVSSA